MTINGFQIKTAINPAREQYWVLSPTNKVLVQKATFAQCWTFVMASIWGNAANQLREVC